ncbi:putative mitochondrial protein [Vitis vinifera]|uniref:Putative mitochondrial protein n=1 Tax=Vitis vinifera TaxID=29760 RepID=A0A438E2X9_VITVI|nr:putative mitochondrial protein [Vitis vinifera]
MTRKTMRNRGFEPWTFRSCLGYHHFVINDNNRDQWKKDFKKTSTATVAEIKTEANVAKKASALVAAIDHGGKFLNTFTPVINSAWIIDSSATNHMTFDSRQDIQTRETIGCGIKRGKLYYLDLQSKDSNELQQALMADGSEGEKKKMTWLYLMKSKNESSDLQKYLEGHDIIHQTTCSITPRQNGVAERKNRHLLKVVRASLIAAKISISYWGEAITSAAYLINREAGELDMSGQQFGSEDVFTEIPNQSSSVEGVLNLELDPFMKRLPHRHNRAIPNSVQETLADLRWKAAMNEEMKSLQKNETWELVECPLGKKLIGMHGVRKAMSEGVQIEEVIVWVEAIPERIVWKETGMSGCQPVNTPIEEGMKLCVEPNQVSIDKGRYQRLVGRLMYLAHIRPDLAYALNVVSQYMHNPGEQHMNAVMRILRYLKNALGKRILFAKNIDHQSIEVYNDTDWAGAVDDRRSTSGYFTFVGGNLVTWKSKKQNVVARSSPEVEFKGMALGLCEAL